MNNNTAQNNDLFDFNYYLGVIFKRFWFLCAVVLLGVFAAVMVNILAKPVYKSTVLMMIDREDSGKIDSTNFTTWASDEDYYRTQYKLLESRTILNKAYHKLNLKQYEEFSTLHKFKKHIKIDPVVRSRLLNIQVSSYDPQLAAQAANTLAEIFVEDNLTNRVSMAKDVIAALESKERSPQEQELLNSMPQVVNSDFIKNLKNQETQIEGELAKLTAKYTDLHPDVISLANQLKALRSKIDVETKRLILSIKIELSGQFSGNNIRIIDRAVAPALPSFPKNLLNLCIGILGGGLLGLFIIFIVDIMDQSIKTSEDMESKLGLPFLGYVPIEKLKDKEAEYSLMLKKGHYLLAENVRNIRTMVNFSLNTEKINAFLVASSLQGEGKTFTSANLAVAFAQTGKKVLLVDGDLRRSRLHKVFKLSTEKGLSNLWSDNSEINSFAYNVQTTNAPNLSVVTAGIRPPNSSELLNTPLLEAFVTWAKENYDLVMIDSPALMPVSDTLLWGRCIDKAVFIIKYGKTNSKIGALTIGKMQKAGIKVLGGIISSYKPGGIAYGKYGYYKETSYYTDEKKK